MWGLRSMELDSREITVVALDIQSICIQSIYFVVSVVNVYFILQLFFLPSWRSLLEKRF